MKYIRPTHWVDIEKQDGLLFFAQILNETLFDYTLPTYKPQALNVRLLCVEAIQTIENINKGLIKKPNIDSIIEELIWSLNIDSVSRYLLGDRFEEIIKRINNDKNNLIKLKEIIILLYHFFDNRKYLKNIEQVLIELIPEGKEKDKIYYLTKNLITEYINYGYTTGFIYHMSNRHYFNNKRPVTEIDPQSFFDLFSFTKKSFTVIYKVSKLFYEFKKVSDYFNFEILDNYPVEGLDEEAKRFIANKKDTEVFIVFEDIEALDNNVARIITEKILSNIGSLFSFYHHKEPLYINDLALVFNNTDSYTVIIEEPIKSIIKKSDTKPRIASNKVKELLTNLNLPSTTSYRIIRAINLHSIALTTEELENKLVNIWTAIETLIPKDTEYGSDRIVHIIDSLLPFQTYKYLNQLIEQLGRDFLFYNRNISNKLLKKIHTINDQESDIGRLSALIMTAENEDIRTELYGLLKNYPLLRWRVFTLNKKLSNGKNIKKMLDNHQQRIKWQVRRIYRVRNLIVHSGRMPSYTNILVENLHNYFDDLLNYVIDNSIAEKRIKSINEAIIDCNIYSSRLFTVLDKMKNDEISLANYKNIIN